MVASVGLAGCGASADLGPELTRRDPEPGGAHCRYGGTAIEIGIDHDADGVLDDGEITATEYECNATAAPLIRTEMLAPGETCPGGGTAILTGNDDDRDGVLENTEIDEITAQCTPLDLWSGDFAAADWSDAVKVAALQGARVIDGSLTIATAGSVRLPLLEIVHGDVVARGTMSGLALPALHEVDGHVVIEAPNVRALSLAGLRRVGGDLSIDHVRDDTSLSAPSLREIVGRLAFGSDARGAVSMPNLSAVGALRDEGALTALQLDALAGVNGELFVADRRLPSLRLPALKAVAGDLTLDGGLQNLSTTAIDLPVLEQVNGDLTIDHLINLTTLSLPMIGQVGGDLSIDPGALVALDLASLEDVAGTFEISFAFALSTMHAPKLRSIGARDGRVTSLSVSSTALQELDLGALSTVDGGITIASNTELRAMRLPALTSAKSLFIDSSPALEVIEAPGLTSLERLAIEDTPALVTMSLSGLVEVTGSVFIFHCAIPDLSGLPALTSVDSFTIFNADRLQDFTGLTSLHRVRELAVFGNPALTSLAGLESLSAIPGSATISDNAALISVAGLQNVASVGGTLDITLDPALRRIELTSLATISGDLTISSDPALISLSGLDALTSLAGALTVTDNAGLLPRDINDFRTRLGK